MLRRRLSYAWFYRSEHSDINAAEEKQKASVKYQVSEQPAAMVREEEFAKQLRLARYLAGASLPPSRPLEPVLKGRAPKQERSVPKARLTLEVIPTKAEEEKKRLIDQLWMEREPLIAKAVENCAVSHTRKRDIIFGLSASAAQGLGKGPHVGENAEAQSGR